MRAAIARHDTRIANLQYVVQTDADADLSTGKSMGVKGSVGWAVDVDGEGGGVEGQGGKESERSTGRRGTDTRQNKREPEGISQGKAVDRDFHVLRDND